jgi:hypothetical protein
MRSSFIVLASFSLAAFSLGACSDATGTLQGGQSLPLSGSSGNIGSASGESGASGGSSGETPSSGGSGGSSGGSTSVPTWTTLYASFFGNLDTGGCGSLAGACHQLAADEGPTLTPPTPASGFVCGTTADSCYAGMQNATPPLLPTGKLSATQLSSNPLWQALFQGGTMGVSSNNMPLDNYVPTATDLAQIKAWLEAGAPNN